MWFIQPKRDYAAEMPWKHTDEPAIMTWQIRARDYNTFIANILFFINFIISLAVGFAIFSFNEPSVSLFLLGAGGGGGSCLLAWV
ncbi:hypothetical protein LCGC14_0265720 [marine sediment metagenome]|uniref:Uncharacterized protein n=1 Tax=marine sediment metagenome TaxID=412755 RepID=A0A0F9UHH5_9ZZZZ